MKGDTQQATLGVAPREDHPIGNVEKRLREQSGRGSIDDPNPPPLLDNEDTVWVERRPRNVHRIVEPGRDRLPPVVGRGARRNSRADVTARLELAFGRATVAGGTVTVVTLLERVDGAVATRARHRSRRSLRRIRRGRSIGGTLPEGRSHGANQLGYRHPSVAIEIDRGTFADSGFPERDSHATDQLRNRNLGIAVAVPRANLRIRGSGSGDRKSQRQSDLKTSRHYVISLHPAAYGFRTALRTSGPVTNHQKLKAAQVSCTPKSFP